MNHICTADCREANDCLGEVRCARCGAFDLACRMAEEYGLYFCDDCAVAIEEEREEEEGEAK